MRRTAWSRTATSPPATVVVHGEQADHERGCEEARCHQPGHGEAEAVREIAAGESTQHCDCTRDRLRACEHPVDGSLVAFGAHTIDRPGVDRSARERDADRVEPAGQVPQRNDGVVCAFGSRHDPLQARAEKG